MIDDLVSCQLEKNKNLLINCIVLLFGQKSALLLFNVSAVIFRVNQFMDVFVNKYLQMDVF